MKTLKQRFKEIPLKDGFLREALEETKEWLTQKRQEVAHQSDLCDDCRAQRRLLDKLLEELNHE